MLHLDGEELGNTFKRLRTEHGYTQKAIAAYLNVSIQAVSKWEKGIAAPGLDRFVSLMGLYNLEAKDMLPTSEMGWYADNNNIDKKLGKKLEDERLEKRRSK